MGSTGPGVPVFPSGVDAGASSGCLRYANNEVSSEADNWEKDGIGPRPCCTTLRISSSDNFDPTPTREGIPGGFPSPWVPWHKLQFAVKMDRPCSSGDPACETLLANSSFSIAGRSLETTYKSPVLGLTVVPPQLTPPLFPGISTVFPNPGGVKRPSL